MKSIRMVTRKTKYLNIVNWEMSEQFTFSTRQLLILNAGKKRKTTRENELFWPIIIYWPIVS